MSIDPIRNFAKAIVSTIYNSSATSIVLNTGYGAKLPDTSVYGAFNLTWFNSTNYPDPSDDPLVEIVRVTSISGDTLTIVRGQEGTTASNKNTTSVTYLMILAPTKKTIDDLQKFSIATDQTDFSSQSFSNILKNGNFESWSLGITSAPDGWSSGSGTSMLADSNSSNKKMGTYGAAVTSPNGAQGYIFSSISDLTYFKGRAITLGGWVKTSTATRVCIYIQDGVSYALSPYHTGSGNWEFLTVPFAVSNSATELTVFCMVYIAGTPITAYFDGMILVEGSIVPAFSPRSLYDDAKTLTIDSIYNRIGINNTSPSEALSVTGNIAITGTVDGVDISAHNVATTGIHGVSGTIVGTTDTQTLSGKTLTSPILTTPTIGDFTNANHTHAATGITGGIIDHVNLTNKGTNTHTQIDTALTASADHIAASGTSVHGLGTMSTQNANSVSVTGGSISGLTTDLAVTDGGTGASDAATARTNLGLGTIATQAKSSVDITGGIITGITDLTVADGGTGASTVSNAKINLGLGVVASDNIRFSSDTDIVSTIGSDPSTAILLKSITITRELIGTQRFVFDLAKEGGYSAPSVYGAVYRNGVVIGSWQACDNTAYQTYSQNITQNWNPGDTCELWGKKDTDISNVHPFTYARNFRIKFDSASLGLGTLSMQDASNVSVTALTGGLVGTHPEIIRKVASNNVRNSNDTEINVGVYFGYAVMKSITLTHGLLGTQRFFFEYRTVNVRESWARIYRNGVPIGTEYYSSGNAWNVITEDITQDWLPGDACELRANSDQNSMYFRNFRIAYDDAPNVTVPTDATDIAGAMPNLANIWLPAEAAYLPATSPAVFNEAPGSSTYAGWSYLTFDDTTAQTAIWRVPFPKYNGGNITVKAFSKPQTTPTGTVTLQYDILTIGLATGGEYNSAVLTDTGVNISHSLTTTTLSTQVQIASATIDPANVAADNLLVIGISRDVVSDNLTGNGHLLGILLEYTKV